MDNKFRDWIHELDETVIQGEFGFEDGEFDMFPEMWRPLYDEGLTPRQAWQRALDAHAAEQTADDQRRKDNWERIKREDAAAIAAQRSKQQ